MPAELVGAFDLVVGQTVIPFSIRSRPSVSRCRITIDSGGASVLVPAGADANERAVRFVNAKRRWVYTHWRRVPRALPDVPRYLSGARVLYRGRRLRLKVVGADVTRARVVMRTGFFVSLPRSVWRAGEQVREDATRAAVQGWLSERLAEDANRLARKYADALGVEFKAVRVLPMKRRWASCGRDRVLRLHPELHAVPRRLFEYVVAHEVAHLVVRSHAPRFWRAVTTILADARSRHEAFTELERKRIK